MALAPMTADEIAVDAELMARITSGDATAAAELFRRHRAAMFALSYRIAKDSTIAEDATQDACLQVWRAAGRYDESRGSARSWLLVITRARTLDRLRSQQLRDDRVRGGFDVETATAPENCAEDALERRDRLRMIGAVMDILPISDRRTVELAFYEGLTHTEIADRLELPLGTAKTQLRRAVQTLRSGVDQRPRRPFEWRTAAPSPQSTLSGARILVVDDESDTVKLTALVLARAGASVIAAPSALQAVERISARWPDVAILDLEMPEWDGYALMSRVRDLRQRERRTLPVVAFTAHGSDRDRHQTASAGFDLHLVKPIRPAVLVRSIGRLLDR